MTSQGVKEGTVSEIPNIHASSQSDKSNAFTSPTLRNGVNMLTHFHKRNRAVSNRCDSLENLTVL